MFRPILLLLPPALLLAALVGSAFGQGTIADYQRAAGLRETTRNKVFRTAIRPQWLSDGSRFWYRVEVGPGKHEFVLVDAAAGLRRPAFDHQRLAKALSNTLGREIADHALPIDRLAFPDSAVAIQFSSGGKWLECSLATYDLKEIEPAAQGAATTVRWLKRPRPSLRTGAETTVTFINRLSETVELFWSDTGGQRHSYGRIEAGRSHDQHTFEGHVWVVVADRGRIVAAVEASADAREVLIDGSRQAIADRPSRRRGRPDSPGRQSRSPDGQWTIVVRDHNLFLRPEGESPEGELPLTTDGSEEEGYVREVHWSPDSQRFVAMKTKRVESRKVNLIETSPSDQLQPKLHTLDYPKPGDPIAVGQPHLFDVPARREIPLDRGLFSTPWSISDVRWAKDSSRFTFLYNQRGHQVLRLVEVNAADGKARAIIDEQSQTFIDYAHKQYIRYLDETGEIIWMSERDGFNHLYLYDAQSGAVKNPITHGPWVVRGVEQIDEVQRQLLLRVAGIEPQQDPYCTQYIRVNFNGSGLVRLTEGNGTHDIEFSPDGKYLIDTWSRVDLPPVTELRNAQDGSLICELEQGDWSVLIASNWHPPMPFVSKGRDGETNIYGVIWRPTNFDAAKTYPVIEHIYAGPQGAFVPKEFRPHYRQQELAELGFVVVQIDGMGTNWRSKRFHDVCFQNLGDGGFPDRIAWMKAAAKQHPWMDITRVGIYGGSAGGQNALGAVLTHGDFYDAAAADCGCHDNRMDKMWWNEAWMGYPIGPHYEQQSNVTNAHKLRGKLLLTVGELDRNVDPASTMQVVNALIKVNKDFEMLVVPGAGHGVGESPYAARRRADFFVRHLLGVEPPDRNR